MDQSETYTMILLEIWEKTQGNGIIWSEIDKGSYVVEFLREGTLYNIWIGKAGQLYVIDVHKNGKMLFTMNSMINQYVERLYLEIGVKMRGMAKNVVNLQRLRRPLVFNFQMNGGVAVRGDPEWAYDFPCSCNQTDVVLLMDVTGSMGGAISKVQDYFVEIRKTFDSSSCRWAVCSYRDFEDPGYEAGFVIHQSFTNDYKVISDAINILRANGGGDGDEQQLAALLGVSYAWTVALGGDPGSDTKRAIIWCGDYPGWNNGAKGKSYPSLETVANALASMKISVLALNVNIAGVGIDGGAPNDGVGRQASRIIQVTGGRLINDILNTELPNVLEQACGFLIDVASARGTTGLSLSGAAELWGGPGVILGGSAL